MNFLLKPRNNKKPHECLINFSRYFAVKILSIIPCYFNFTILPSSFGAIV